MATSKFKASGLILNDYRHFNLANLDFYNASTNHKTSMKTTTRANQIFAIHFWNILPFEMQKLASKLVSVVYTWKISKFFIGHFCRRYRINADQLNHYVPGSGAENYKSFQDFFTRKLKTPFSINSAAIIMPCQGFVCENGQVSEFSKVIVKGRAYSIRNIFDDMGAKITDSYTFINIFLHNHNYHRFHAPVTGTVLNIRTVPGQLNFLRPWFYERRKVSSPSFVNERCIVEIEDQQKQSWFLSFVAGMGVGHIKLTNGLQIGSKLMAGDEIGYFLLGSTCCIAAPVPAKKFTYMQKVELGELL